MLQTEIGEGMRFFFDVPTTAPTALGAKIIAEILIPTVPTRGSFFTDFPN